LPKTSLLIMTCAFAGYDLAMEAYKKAIKDKYRFFSYGDALLIIFFILSVKFYMLNDNKIGYANQITQHSKFNTQNNYFPD
jgi:hypothetical protein